MAGSGAPRALTSFAIILIDSTEHIRNRRGGASLAGIRRESPA